MTDFQPERHYTTAEEPPSRVTRIYEHGTDLNLYRGRSGTMALNDLAFGVEVKDARLRFGHLDFLITPIEGSGEIWVESHRVNLV